MLLPVISAGTGQADIGQHGGCDIGQAAALAQLHITAATATKAQRWWCGR